MHCRSGDAGSIAPVGTLNGAGANGASRAVAPPEQVSQKTYVGNQFRNRFDHKRIRLQDIRNFDRPGIQLNAESIKSLTIRWRQAIAFHLIKL